MNKIPTIVAKVFRGQGPESYHCGSVAVVDSEGRLRYKIGDPYLLTFMRSTSKPFQAIPVVESGAARKFDFSSKELAIMAGSHSGEPEHIDTVRSILDKIGLSEKDLQCGVHVPHRYTVMEVTPEPGRTFTPIEHNCSGKHAGMLATAVFKNLSTGDYLSPEHPVQQLIRKTISEICHYPEENLVVAIDGCSAPNFSLPLYNMALGFARLITPNAVPKEQAKAYSAISRAMMEHPEMVAGTKRFDTILAQSQGEPIISKAGAEATLCMAFTEKHMGTAIKISDGNPRALYPVAVEFLYKMGVRMRQEQLDVFHHPVIKNWRGLDVGRIEPGFELEEVAHE